MPLEVPSHSNSQSDHVTCYDQYDSSNQNKQKFVEAHVHYVFSPLVLCNCSEKTPSQPAKGMQETNGERPSHPSHPYGGLDQP